MDTPTPTTTTIITNTMHGSAVPAAPPAPVPHMLATLDDALGRLHATINDLESRCSTIVSADDIVIDTNTPVQPHPGSSEVRNLLVDLVARLDSASDRVARLTRRIEA